MLHYKKLFRTIVCLPIEHRLRSCLILINLFRREYTFFFHEWIG